MSTYVKICGVTRPEDALSAAELGADAIGLNFYPRSPRLVELEQAMEIAAAVRGKLELFGIFVNEEAKRVAEITASVGLDRLQFHGDENPEWIVPFGERAVKALRFTGQRPPRREIERYSTVGGFLFEPRQESRYGGTGTGWEYDGLAQVTLDRPWLLSGGLRPESVAEALLASGAPGVDVCSGVESAPGIKDFELMRAFLQETHSVATPRI